MDNICPYVLVGSSCSILKSWNSVLGFIICVSLSHLLLLGDLSAETNTDFNVTCEKRE